VCVCVCEAGSKVCYLSMDLIWVSRYRQELCWFVRAVERAAASKQSQFLIRKVSACFFSVRVSLRQSKVERTVEQK